MITADLIALILNWRKATGAVQGASQVGFMPLANALVRDGGCNALPVDLNISSCKLSSYPGSILFL